MPIEISPNMKLVSWSDIRAEIKIINPELFNIVEEISPGKEYELIEANYAYGDSIVSDGIACIPLQNKGSSKINSKYFPKEIAEKLNYSSTPLIMQLSSASEVFLNFAHRCIPLYLFMPGDLYGLFEALTPLTGCPSFPIWSVSAGAKSVFMLPKISDAVSHNRLKASLGILSNLPKGLSDHWAVFKEISKKMQHQFPWNCRVLFFTKKWLENREDDIAWLKFQKYLLKSGWIQSRHMRSRTEFNAIWEAFSQAVSNRNLKPSPYLVDTIKHLLTITTGSIPGFKPVNSHKAAALPSEAIELAYRDVYQLDRAPTLMHPYRLGENNDRSPVYYSLSYPTLLESAPSARYKISIMTELRECKLLMDMLIKVLEEYSDTAFQIVHDKFFEYFHSDKDRFGEIESSKEVACSDPNVLSTLKGRFKGLAFADHSAFLKGCVRISMRS